MKNHLKIITNIFLTSIGLSVLLGSLLRVLGPINQNYQINKKVNTVGKSSSSFKKELLTRNSNISLFYNGDEVDPRGEVSDWFRSDLNFSRNISDKAKIYFKVKNIFDEEYQDIYGYGTEERSFSIGINLSAG